VWEDAGQADRRLAAGDFGALAEGANHASFGLSGSLRAVLVLSAVSASTTLGERGLEDLDDLRATALVGPDPAVVSDAELSATGGGLPGRAGKGHRGRPDECVIPRQGHRPGNRGRPGAAWRWCRTPGAVPGFRVRCCLSCCQSTASRAHQRPRPPIRAAPRLAPR
jgi:hypothetical protein